MQRREFIKTTALATAGAVFMPYILPTGRLFAASGMQLAQHVVYVLFAGGVRQQESVLQRYLSDGQGVNSVGNIMYNMLNGAAPTSKIIYGTNMQGQPSGSQPIPKILNTSLQQQGTLLPEMRYSKGGTGHYGGLNTILTGNYTQAQGLKQRPVFPSVFEYVRRHLNVPATKTWFVGNGIGNSIPLLNYSNHNNYGQMYGANFIAPTTAFGEEGDVYYRDTKIYHPDEQGDIDEMRTFLNNSFSANLGDLDGVKNTDADRALIKQFMAQTFQKRDSGQLALPPVTDNGDTYTMGFACEVLKNFKPTLTVVNFNNVDACHSSYTNYLKALHRADHAVGHLWNYIQTQIPEMAGNTAIVVQPEHGRNLEPNPIVDSNNFKAFDHDSDANSRRVFGLMAGRGVPQNTIIGSANTPKGDSTDSILTIAELLGCKPEVQQAGLVDSDAASWFDRM